MDPLAPVPAPPQPAAGPGTGQKALALAGGFWSRLRLDFRRAVKPDWDAGVATDAERALLAAPRASGRTVVGREAQDYLAWRRALLFVSSVFLGVFAVVATIVWIVETAKNDLDPQQFEVAFYRTVTLIRLLGGVYLAWCSYRALAAWDDLVRSHRSMMRGWIVGLLVPFLLAVIPVSAYFRLPEIDPEQALQREMGLQLLGLIVGVKEYFMLFPAFLSIFVGALRSALLVKRFLPEAAAPGWIAVVSAPVFFLALLSLLALLAQIGASPLLIVGFLLVVVRFALYIRHGAALVRPTNRAGFVAALNAVNRTGTWILAAGALLILVGLFTTKLFGMHLYGFGDKAMESPFVLVKLAIEFIGRALFTAMLFSDLLVALLRHSWSEANAMRVGELSGLLEARLRHAEEAGIADLRAKKAA